MDVSLALPHVGASASPRAIARAAVEAERMGCETVWVLERLLRPTNSEHRAMPEAFAKVYAPVETLAYVAGKTERLRLGTSVIDALFHTPAMLARRLATLDALSDGRVVAGLGQGYSPEEFEAANVPIGRRGAGFEEFIAALRAAWGPDPVTFGGRFYRIPPSEIGPKPVQPGGPPILVGGSAASAVERAGRIGAGLNPVSTAWERLGDTIALFRRSAREAGHEPAALPVVVRVDVSRLTAYRPGEERRPSNGSREQMGEDLARLREYDVDGVFFDLTRVGLDADEQVRLVAELRKAAH